MKLGLVTASFAALAITGMLSAQSAPMPAPKVPEGQYKIVAPKAPKPPKPPKAPKAPMPPAKLDGASAPHVITLTPDGEVKGGIKFEGGPIRLNGQDGEAQIELQLEDLEAHIKNAVGQKLQGMKLGDAIFEIQGDDACCEGGDEKCDGKECEDCSKDECDDEDCDDCEDCVIEVEGSHGGMNGLGAMLHEGMKHMEITLNGEKLDLHDLGRCIESAVRGHMNGKMNIAVNLGGHAMKLPIDHCPIVAMLGGHGHGAAKAECEGGACSPAQKHGGDCCCCQGGCCGETPSKKTVRARVVKPQATEIFEVAPPARAPKATKAPARMKVQKVEIQDTPSELPKKKSVTREFVINTKPHDKEIHSYVVQGEHGGGMAISESVTHAPKAAQCEVECQVKDEAKCEKADGQCEVKCEVRCEDECNTCEVMPAQPKAAPKAKKPAKVALGLAPAAPAKPMIGLLSPKTKTVVGMGAPASPSKQKFTVTAPLAGSTAPAMGHDAAALKNQLSNLQLQIAQLEKQIADIQAMLKKAK